MFVEMGAVEEAKPVLVLGKMRGDPIENDPDPFLVQSVDQPHEILWWAKAAGRSEIPGGRVSPRAVKGMFHHRHELGVGETQPAEIRRKLFGKLPIGQVAIVLAPSP